MKAEVAAEWIAIDELKPWEQNPRSNDHVVSDVAKSIERFGFASPIIARRNGQVIAGHTRLKAAQSLGLDRVPVRFMDLDPADAKMLALADNRIGELAEWEDARLEEILKELTEQGLDLSVLGWGDELPVFQEEPDYSLLGDDNDGYLDDLAAGVRKALQIEFDSKDYEEASALVSWFRQQGWYIGGFLLEHLREKKANHEA